MSYTYTEYDVEQVKEWLREQEERRIEAIRESRRIDAEHRDAQYARRLRAYRADRQYWRRINAKYRTTDPGPPSKLRIVWEPCWKCGNQYSFTLIHLCSYCCRHRPFTWLAEIRKGPTYKIALEAHNHRIANQRAPRERTVDVRMSQGCRKTPTKHGANWGVYQQHTDNAYPYLSTHKIDFPRISEEEHRTIRNMVPISSWASPGGRSVNPTSESRQRPESAKEPSQSVA